MSPGSRARRRSRRNVRAQLRSKLPMVLPRNSTRNDSRGLAFGGRARHAVQIGLHQRIHFGDAGQIALATRQCIGRDIDGIIAQAGPANCLQKMPRFLSHSAAEFDDRDARRKERRDVGGMPLQQTLVRARESIFGQMRDGLKQRAAQAHRRDTWNAAPFAAWRGRRARPTRIRARWRRIVREL